MEQLLEQARTVLEGEIDFEGQKLAELLTYAILSISGVVAFFAGYFTQNIYNTLYTGLGGTALTFLLVVPPWPFYNQHPQPWLPPKTGRQAWQGVSIEVDGKKVS
ncbi:hypothetical protein KC367_g6619 [Hortaea werneckii]|uniref:Signal peptidase complex subunit 1 n=2 Tax=Hortaea werneckii TaxID=91943 RepID=A0A3M7IRS2_HORWE|nr:hypothetical protein KC358_g11691 [Hortaea werneckii]OTA28617.1 hypothetical protein BTJ68_08993 [Hortaea werneckii EXF-2000]KAI6818211.1 hypothetical protein KC342_g14629 [Hortaea werneckii]KAI6820262.1 hypothetical protein KC350_g9850 [Hortaea werneckii]KAI6920544.1 hypothetical protein KC348_g10351 [Hortaea werneckii]